MMVARSTSSSIWRVVEVTGMFLRLECWRMPTMRKRRSMLERVLVLRMDLAVGGWFSGMVAWCG